MSRLPALIIGSMVKVMPACSAMPWPRAAVVQDLRLLVEAPADAVAAEFAHDAVAVRLGVALDGVADVAQGRARAHLRDALPHAFVGDLAQAPRLDGGLAHEEHAARVAVPAVLDDGDVDVHDVAVTCSTLSPGTPWQTWWFTEVQIDLG